MFTKIFAGLCGVLLVNIAIVVATLSFLGYLPFKDAIFSSIFLFISGAVEIAASVHEELEDEEEINGTTDTK